MRFTKMASAALALALLGIAAPAVTAKATKATEALVRLDDVPDGYSRTSSPAGKERCVNMENILKPGSTSSARVRFDTSTGSIIHVAAVYATEAAAEKGLAAMGKWAKDCAKYSYKIDGTKFVETIGEMKFTPQTKPDQIKAWRGTTTGGSVDFEAIYVVYRQRSTTGVVIVGSYSADLDLAKSMVDVAIGRA